MGTATRSGSAFLIRAGGCATSFALLLSPSGLAQGVERVSLGFGEVQGLADSRYPSISADARAIAFTSNATNLVPGDSNGVADVFVRDRKSGTTVRASVGAGDAQADGPSDIACLSADGRIVAFTSSATNLVSGDGNASWDTFVHDLESGLTERVSVDSQGQQGNDNSWVEAISWDGRFVAFSSAASNLVAGDTNGVWDVFVHDRWSGTTERASVASNGLQADGEALGLSLSADGRLVAFESRATNLVAGDGNGRWDVFVHDRATGSTIRASVASDGSESDGDSADPVLSADGRFVAFHSCAGNLDVFGADPWFDVFVHELATGITRRASVDSLEQPVVGDSWSASISADGRLVAFASMAAELVSGDTNLVADVFVHDFETGVTTRASAGPKGVQGLAASGFPSLSADGLGLAFESDAANFVLRDTNAAKDVFLRDLGGVGFPTSCEPGSGGVIACPCGNPPARADAGCDNSAFTGGARLFAEGLARLSDDSLVFQTSGEKPNAASVLLQGDAEIAGGVVFGQGVRCVGGNLKRLFFKVAAGGSLLAPDFAAGDASVSQRSAALGDALAAGETRWYLVYYRDAVVPGGCPEASTFNSTQTGRVSWLP